MRLEELWNQAGNQAQALRQPAPPVQPSPVMIQVRSQTWQNTSTRSPLYNNSTFQTLTDMGFPRQRVEQALVRANNDLDQATNILLNDF